MTNKPFAWSYTALTSFETCPWRYKLTKITKQVQEAPYDHRNEGNLIHKAFELHLKGEAWLPDQYKKWLPMLERLKKAPGELEAERKVALTPQFTETTYFGKDVWLRAGFDVRLRQANKSTLLDWKNGKRKFDADQLKLFAGVEFKLSPDVDVVETAYVWLQTGKIDKETFTRDQAPIIWQEFTQRVGRIEHAIKTDNFPKRPSGLCRQWCPVGKRLCEHCGT
jgi:hypothetical protein